MKHLRDNWAYLFLAGMLLSAGASCSRIGARGRINERLEAIKKAGLPLTLVDLDKSYQQPASEENAAPLLEDSFGRFQLSEADTLSVPLFGKEKLPEIGIPLTSATKKKVAQLLAKNQQALSLLHEASSRKKCRFPVDLKQGATIFLPHLAKMRSAVKLLELEALANAETNRVEEAVQSVISSYRLAHLLEAEPLLISQLVRFAIDNESCSSLERILNIVSLTDGQLASILSVVKEEQSTVGMMHGLSGERCLGIAVFQMPLKEREAYVARSIKELGGSETPESSWDDDFALFLQAMEEAITASRSPFPDNLQGGERLALRVAEAKRKKLLFSGATLDAFVGLFRKQAQHEARLRCAEASLGVQRYRLAQQNNLPASLDAIVPGILKAVPADPFDGTPLEYRRESAIRYTISSSQDDPKAKDLVFRVFK